MKTIVVSALYKFVDLPHYKNLKTPLLALMQAQGIKGSLLLAKEGINGTVAGTPHAIAALYAWFATEPAFSPIHTKESYHDDYPFHRTKVKLKKEIVTMGVDGIDPKKAVGTYVKPEDWNALISQEDVTLIDTRNDYEVQIGQFKGAKNPLTQSFREFPDYVKQHLDPQKHRKIAMYCTGGIRCEKSTAYLLAQGFESVYHLEGGILKYLETVPSSASLWEGECFVFDERVAVTHDLQKGSYDQCHACRTPISAMDKAHPSYLQGVSCPHCKDNQTAQQSNRYQERQKQNQLAKARGENHLGGDVFNIINTRRLQKKQKRQAQASTKG